MKTCVLICSFSLIGNYAFCQSNLSVKKDFSNPDSDSTITPAISLIDGAIVSSAAADSLKANGKTTTIEIPTRKGLNNGDNAEGGYYFLKPNEDK